MTVGQWWRPILTQALTVTCPECGAPPTNECLRVRRNHVHGTRIQLARRS